MDKSTSVDNYLFKEMNRDIGKTKNWGYTFIASGILLQALHFLLNLIDGFTFMLIMTGVILVISGMLFILGTSSVPKSRGDVVQRLEKIMLTKNPKRRLWAAQRLVGYAKDANFSKEEILSLTRELVRVVKNPPVHQKYRLFVAVDHIVVLREIAVSVKMNKHVRKEFTTIIKPLKKIEGFPDEAYELLSDTIGYHPSKLAVHAYEDYKKDDN